MPNPYKTPSTSDHHIEENEVSCEGDHGSDHKNREMSILLFVLGVLCFGGLGVAFVVAMHTADFERQGWILLWMGLVVFLLSIILPFLRIPVLLSAYLIFPFCIYIFGRFCGDVGKVHMFDGVPLFFAMVLLFVVVTVALIWKAIFAFAKRNEKETVG